MSVNITDLAGSDSQLPLGWWTRAAMHKMPADTPMTGKQIVELCRPLRDLDGFATPERTCNRDLNQAVNRGYPGLRKVGTGLFVRVGGVEAPDLGEARVCARPTRRRTAVRPAASPSRSSEAEVVDLDFRRVRRDLVARVPERAAGNYPRQAQLGQRVELLLEVLARAYSDHRYWPSLDDLDHLNDVMHQRWRYATPGRGAPRSNALTMVATGMRLLPPTPDWELIAVQAVADSGRLDQLWRRRPVPGGPEPGEAYLVVDWKVASQPERMGSVAVNVQGRRYQAWGDAIYGEHFIGAAFINVADTTSSVLYPPGGGDPVPLSPTPLWFARRGDWDDLR